MKKMATALLGLALAGAVFTGCGGGNRAQDLDHHDHAKVGILAHMNASEEKLNEIMKRVDETWTSKFSHDYVYYDRLTAMQMGLNAGNIQEMSLYESVAHYLSDRDGSLEVVEHQGMKLVDSFCCALRQEDKELKEKMDEAIEGMRADGTLDKLTKAYITDLQKDSEPPSVPLPDDVKGAPLKVAVTGDLPPLDLVRADGKAAGFNTAFLAELGRRLGRSVEIVQVDSAGRAAALKSKKVDVIFWATVPFGESEVPADIDKPEGVELTLPYYRDNIVHVEKKE